MGHKCFISFKTEDASYKRHIQTQLDVDMIDKSLDEPIDSDDEDYILRKIREDFLSDSTVTTHLIGSWSAETFGWAEQRFIKRELQASLYNGTNSGRSGILGVVLPAVTGNVYKGMYKCLACGNSHNCVAINDTTTVREFSYNYYIPNGKCCHTEDERYCVLARWEEFCVSPNEYIAAAFAKRSQPIAAKVKVKDGA